MIEGLIFLLYFLDSLGDKKQIFDSKITRNKSKYFAEIKQ